MSKVKNSELVTYICPHCNSEDMDVHHYSTWDVEAQRWEMGDIVEGMGYCHNCESSFESPKSVHPMEALALQEKENEM